MTVFHISFDVSTKYKNQAAKVAWNESPRNRLKFGVEFRVFCYHCFCVLPLLSFGALCSVPFRIPFLSRTLPSYWIRHNSQAAPFHEKNEEKKNSNLWIST